MDASDLGGGDDHDVRLFLAEKIKDCALIAKIQLVAGGCENLIAAEFFRLTDEGFADHAAVTRDE